MPKPIEFTDAQIFEANKLIGEGWASFRVATHFNVSEAAIRRMRAQGVLLPPKKQRNTPTGNRVQSERTSRGQFRARAGA